MDLLLWEQQVLGKDHHTGVHRAEYITGLILECDWRLSVVRVWSLV